MERLHLRFRLLAHEPKIVLRLKVDPDLRLSAEDPGPARLTWSRQACRSQSKD
jgi:hypothetical protein